MMLPLKWLFLAVYFHLQIGADLQIFQAQGNHLSAHLTQSKETPPLCLSSGAFLGFDKSKNCKY